MKNTGRLVMEKALGHPLAKDEFVHHKNGDRKDNTLNNLLVVSPSEHRKLHHRTRKGTKSVRREKRLACLRCGQPIPIDKQRQRRHYCPECFLINARQIGEVSSSMPKIQIEQRRPLDATPARALAMFREGHVKQVEIARLWGVHPSRVSVLIKRALKNEEKAKVRASLDY